MKVVAIFFITMMYWLTPSTLQAQASAIQSSQVVEKSKNIKEKQLPPKQAPKKSSRKGKPSLNEKTSKDEKILNKVNLNSSVSKSNKIDINQAEVDVLVKSIKGLSVKKAQALLNYRVQHGHLKSFDELYQIKGLGKKFVKEHLKEFEKYFLIA